MAWFSLIGIVLILIILVHGIYSSSVLFNSRNILINSGVDESLRSSFEEDLKSDKLPFNSTNDNVRYLTVYYLILHKAICLTEPYINELFRQRRSGVIVERYGVINTQMWDTEYKFFYENIIDYYMKDYLITLSKDVLVPFFKENENQIWPNDDSYDFYHEDLFVQLKKCIEISYLKVEDEVELQDLDFIIDGFLYEKELAKYINQKCDGWESYSTSGSGDQGVDVVATHRSSGLTVAIQAKLYSGNVGNKAVQEISAGRQHFNYNFGAVVTNSKFTTSAYNLAESLNVKLLHHSQLQDYLEKLGK